MTKIIRTGKTRKTTRITRMSEEEQAYRETQRTRLISSHGERGEQELDRRIGQMKAKQNGWEREKKMWVKKWENTESNTDKRKNANKK